MVPDQAEKYRDPAALGRLHRGHEGGQLDRLLGKE
jgi:hypothetical protein